MNSTVEFLLARLVTAAVFLIAPSLGLVAVLSINGTTLGWHGALAWGATFLMQWALLCLIFRQNE